MRRGEARARLTENESGRERERQSLGNGCQAPGSKKEPYWPHHVVHSYCLLVCPGRKTRAIGIRSRIESLTVLLSQSEAKVDRLQFEHKRKRRGCFGACDKNIESVRVCKGIFHMEHKA